MSGIEGLGRGASEVLIVWDWMSTCRTFLLAGKNQKSALSWCGLYFREDKQSFDDFPYCCCDLTVRIYTAPPLLFPEL